MELRLESRSIQEALVPVTPLQTLLCRIVSPGRMHAPFARIVVLL